MGWRDVSLDTAHCGDHDGGNETEYCHADGEGVEDVWKRGKLESSAGEALTDLRDGVSESKLWSLFGQKLEAH